MKFDWKKVVVLPALAFGVGSVAANLFIRTIFFKALFPFIVSLIPNEQVLIRLLFAFLLLIVGLAIGGVTVGAIGGYTIGKSYKKSKYFYAKRAGLVLGVTQVILIIPALLLLAIISRYNNGLETIPKDFMIMFGFIGAVYGLLSGFLMAIVTTGLYRLFRFTLFSTSSFALGGTLLGAGLWWMYIPTTQGEAISRPTVIFGFLLLSSFYNAVGGASWSYSIWKASLKNKKEGKLHGFTHKYRNYFIVTILLVSFVWFADNFGRILDFLTVRPATLSEQLSLKTEGSHWVQLDTPVRYSLASNIEGIRCVEGAVRSDEGVISDLNCIEGILSVEDSQGVTHAIWRTDSFGENQYIVESLQTDRGWTEPIVIARVGAEAKINLGTSGNSLVLDVGETDREFYKYTPYSCETKDLSKYGQIITNTITEGEYWDTAELPLCSNEYSRLVYMPNPRPEYSEYEQTPDGGFDTVSDMIESAHHEVLFSNMEWQKASDNDNPGSVFGRAVVGLYDKLKESPENHPRGIQVKILLGNYPVTADFEWGTQLWHVIEDLKASGLETFEDESVGWEVQISNFEGTWPHSHSKFVVVDGKEIMVAGFNYGYLHYPEDHSSGKGYDLEDLGIAMQGPIAQMGVSVFDDLWEGSNVMECPQLESVVPEIWKANCFETKGVVAHSPEVLRYFNTDGESEGYSLYRNEVFKEADDAIYDLVSSAENSLDFFQVNFSHKIYCSLAVLFPDICTYENRLPYMDAITTAIEENDVEVRILVEPSNMNGIENLISIKLFERELEKRVIRDNVEFKFFGGKMHDKAILIDDEFLIVGSHNMHYSAWGKSGLVEYSLATNDSTAVEDFLKLFDFHWDRSEYVKNREQLTSTP